MKIEKEKLNVASTSFISMLGGDNNSVKQLFISDLTAYPAQPFLVIHDEELLELAEDIKRNGILFPVIVRPFNSTYQILAGHRRTAAAQLTGLEQVPCIIKDVDDAAAKLIVTNTNLTQRQKLLPSERAFAYLMQKEAYEELGTHSVRTTSKIAEESEDSVRMVQYYLKLTKLCKTLIVLVDKEMIGVKIGASLSEISIQEQELLADFLINTKIKLTEGQGKDILSLSEVTEEELNNLFLSKKRKKEDELKYELYTVTKINLSRTKDKLRELEYSKIFENDGGVTLGKKNYEKLLKAQEVIEKQFEVIQKLIMKNSSV